MINFSKQINEGYQFIPNDDKEHFKKEFGNLSIALRKSMNERLNEKKLFIYEYILNLKYGQSITHISKEMTKRFGEGYSVWNTWSIINFLEEKGFIHTIGGKREGGDN